MKTYALPTSVGWLFSWILFLQTGLSVSSQAQTFIQSYTTTGYYSYTVPAGGPFSVTLTTRGGDGGNSPSYQGGSGAKMVSTTTVQGGDQLICIVGQAGQTSNDAQPSNTGGGGGGTAIILKRGNDLTLLMASSGGGGASQRWGNGGGGQGLGSGDGGAGSGNAISAGGGGGGGYLSAGGDGKTSSPVQGGTGGKQASLTSISSGGNNYYGNCYGGSGFGGGGGGTTLSYGGGGGGGYGGGDGGGGGNGVSQGGNSYGTGTITLGVDGGGAKADGLATIQFAANSIKAILTSTTTTNCSGQTISIPGSITATGNWTLQLSGGATVSGTNSGTFAVAVSPTVSTTYTIASAAYTNIITQSTTLTGSAIVKIATPATRLYVKANASGAQTGLSWNDAFTSLQDALNYGCPTALTEIWVASGTYKPGTTRSASFAMLPNVSIYGGFTGTESDLSQRPRIDPINGSPSSSTLSGDVGPSLAAYHVIYNPNSLNLTSSARLDGFVISGGNANGLLDNQLNGGGIYNDGSGSGHVCNPTIANCLFANNQTSAYGGAIYNGGRNSGLSSPTLINCAFTGNYARIDGGAIYNDGFLGVSSPSITNCLFVGNQTNTTGAAITNMARQGISSPTLVNCGFLNNSAGGGNGGAINNFAPGGNCLPTFTNCSFQGNIANYGSLMISAGLDGICQSTLINCVLFNQGSNAFYNNLSSVRLLSCLIESTTIDYTTDPSNLTATTNPFSSTASLTLNACTPAINAGLSSASALNGISTDLANNPRLAGTAVDMGAYEFQGDPSFPIAFTQQPPSASALCGGTALNIPTSLTGTGPITYQWFKSGTSLSAQTTNTLSLTSLQATDAGSYALVATGACNSLTSSAFSLTVNTVTAAILNPGPGSLTLSCVSSTVSLTATGGTTYQWEDASTQPVRLFSQAGTYSVIVSSALGCSATASATLYFRNTLNSSAMAYSPMAPVNAVVNMLATGGNAYEWTAPSSASFTTSSTNANISAQLLSAGPQTFTVVITLGACQQTRTVSVTATNGPDLTPSIYMPDATFDQSATPKYLLVQLFEVGWIPTAPGSVTITITAPLGYSLTFDASQTTASIAGGTNNPVAVNNTGWQLISNQNGQQLTLQQQAGVFIRAGSQSVLGLGLIRTNANGGSISNLTINVSDDTTNSYDRFSQNNVYTRILNAL